MTTGSGWNASCADKEEGESSEVVTERDNDELSSGNRRRASTRSYAPVTQSRARAKVLRWRLGHDLVLLFFNIVLLC